ncbi:hypothetical protein EDB81DRAFT_878981 [Dactylonectria macrodidyma]|uniref:Uncharacterized protein n=1 Tax=Dactylonectria macrodidyma TaxID=307937 RepID=A0A9P9FF01_9HYPO|nr:hypothetical protein EDB81DRAFT_878981 [Dactylonectria macrodidyma]
MASTKSTLISLLAAFPSGILARNVISAPCLDGECADGRQASLIQTMKQYPIFTNTFAAAATVASADGPMTKCGAGCTSSPCIEVDWRSIDCAVAEDAKAGGNIPWENSQTDFVFEEALNSWLSATGTGSQQFFGDEGTGTSLTCSEYMVKYVRGPANMKCATLVDRNGCDGFLEKITGLSMCLKFDALSSTAIL